jgi:hypothetical protein
MKRQLFIILTSVAVIGATYAKPAAALKHRYDCGKGCGNSSNCTTSG